MVAKPNTREEAMEDAVETIKFHESLELFGAKSLSMHEDLVAEEIFHCWEILPMHICIEKDLHLIKHQ